MSSENEFESRLRGQPWKAVPDDWRAEVLGAARAAAAQERSSRPASADETSWLATKLAAWLWPHPKAWAGLAAVWAAIAILNVSARDGDLAATRRQMAQPSPQMRQLLRQQQQMLADLGAQPDKQPAERPKPSPGRPRSEGFRNSAGV